MLEALSRDEPGALNALLTAFWDPLVRYANGFLKSTDDASDVVQDCFVRLWKRREEWRNEGSARAFLYCIVRSAALDHLRKAKRRFQRALRATRQRAWPPQPDEVLAERELLSAMKRAIANLPPRPREVFLLAHVHDLSYREIAKVLGISPQTAANHLCAALGALRSLAGSVSNGVAEREERRQPAAHRAPGLGR